MARKEPEGSSARDPIEIDLALRDAAYVFAHDKQATTPGPQREAMQRRLLQFVAQHDTATEEHVGAAFVARRSTDDS